MIHLDKENLKDLVSSGTHLVDFYAEWCGPCKMLGPILEGISDKIDVIKVDIDKHEKLAFEYKVMSVPTLFFFKDGNVVEEVVGFHNEDELLEIIDNL